MQNTFINFICPQYLYLSGWLTAIDMFVFTSKSICVDFTILIFCLDEVPLDHSFNL